jgi:hypothetical protein
MVSFLLLFAVLIIASIFMPTAEGFTAYTRLECPTRNSFYGLQGEAAFPKRRNFAFGNSAIGPMDPARCVWRPSTEFFVANRRR